MSNKMRIHTIKFGVDSDDAKSKTISFTRALQEHKAAEEAVKKAYGETATIEQKVAKTKAELTQEARLLVRQTEAQAKKAAALTREYKFQAAMSKKTGIEAEKLNAIYRLGANATLTQKKEIIKLINAQNTLNKSSQSTQNSFRGLRGQAQNLGWQMQDVAVQMQMGTDAMVIFTQQGSQVASGFGPKGAVIGAIIAVAGAVGGVLFKSFNSAAEQVKELEENVSDLEASLIKLSGGDKTTEIDKSLQMRDAKRNVYDLSLELKSAEKNLISLAEIASKKTMTIRVGGATGYEKTVPKGIVQAEEEAKAVDLQKKAIENYKKQIAAQEKIASGATNEWIEAEKRKWEQSLKLAEEWLKEDELIAEEAEKKAKDRADRLFDWQIAMAEEELKADEDAEKERQKFHQESVDSFIAADKWYTEFFRQQAKERESAATKSLAKQHSEMERMQQEHISVMAKYTDSGKLIQLSTQQAKEIEMAQGHGETINAINEHYAKERAKVNGTFWERQAIAAEESIKKTDEMMAESLDRMISGTADAFASSIIGAESFGEALEGMFKGAMQSMIAYFAELAIQQLLMYAFGKATKSTEQAGESAAMGFNTQAKVFEAGLNAFTATAAIPIVGPAAAPAAAATAIGLAQPFATAATTLSTAAIGVYDKGGMIPSGHAGIVAEYGDELVGGTMIYNGSQNSLGVTGREDTARKVGGNTSNNFVINSNGNASPEAIARAVARVMKKPNKQLDNAVYGSMNRGRKNGGKRIA